MESNSTKCKCGCGLDVKNEIKVLVADVEKDIGFELGCNSGARCPTYNATIQGSVAGDAHELGLAIDTPVDPDTPEGRERIALIIEALTKRGVRRFGDGMGNHHYLHFDRADTLPTPRWWFYPIIILIAMSISIPCHAILGLEKIPALIGEMSAVKVDIAKNATALATANVDIGKNMTKLADISARIGNIEARVNGQGNAVAALKSDIQQQQTEMHAGGNITTTTGASDTLIKFIFGKWYLFLGAFMTFFGTLIAQYERLLAAKDKQIQRLMDSEEVKDTKADDWFRKYLESVTGHRTNGLTPGQQEAKNVLDETIKSIKEGDE